jgi:hypothetical protein
MPSSAVYKMSAIGLIMTHLQDIINFIISDTSSDLKIKPYVEKISIDPGEPCIVLND